FFDEAHLLFDDAPKALLDRIELVVRLIRSKGVGVFFISQNPLDVPDIVLGQLGNRIQHALRAFTPRDQKAVNSAATTFRQNPALDITKAITELQVGEALVSMLEDKGTPGIVQRTLIAPPASRVGPALPSERQAVFAASPMAGRYDVAIDRESAYEQLRARAEAAVPRQAPSPTATSPAGERTTRGRKPPPSFAETFASSAARSIGSRLGREIVRGVLGSFFRSR
ncbi:MAG: helicase HerA-like domain-containing protein, partial [Bacteroidota bacterium]